MLYTIPAAYICAIELEKRRQAEAEMRPHIEIVDPRIFAHLWLGRAEGPRMEDDDER